MSAREELRALERDYRQAYDAALRGEPNRLPDIAHKVLVALPALLDDLDAAERERDEWRARRDRAVETCRFRHQDGLTAEEWHTRICGAMQGAQRERARAETAEAQVEAVRALAEEWESPSRPQVAGWKRHAARALRAALDTPADTPTERCSTCGGLNGAHGSVHTRHDNGGGSNRPCPNTPPCGSCGEPGPYTITLRGEPTPACLRHLNHWRTPTEPDADKRETYIRNLRDAIEVQRRATEADTRARDTRWES